VTCPLAGIGARSESESNRLVVDDPATEVTIADRTITLRDDRACAPKTVIADLVWLAEGPAPFTIHIEVFKTGHTWSIDLHTHEPTPLTERRRAIYEPFTIVAIDGSHREVLVDRERLARAVTHVPFARRLSGALTTTRDHLRHDRARTSSASSASGSSGSSVVFDRSIGIGALGRGMFLIRAQLSRLDRGSVPVAPRVASIGWSTSAESIDRSTSAESIDASISAESIDRSTSAESIDPSTSTESSDPSISAESNCLSTSVNSNRRSISANSINASALASMLAQGAWELSLEALTDRWLPELVARDLVLFGLADVPLLAELRAGKLRRGQTLAFRTTGEVRLDGETAPLPGALDIARAYLEFHMLGGIIAAAFR